MSDTHVPQTPDTQPQVGQGTPAYPHAYAAETRGAGAGPKKMSTFLKVSIILLIGLTVASISLLFIGDFEGRFERVFSTFALFAVFVVFTAIDTSRERKNDWYAPVALIANTYILGLLLIVIWITSYDPFSLMFDIFWKSVLVIVVTRLVILCCELLLRAGAKSGGATNTFAFITSVLAVLSGILFTAPVGIEAFDLEIPDLYWKIATAVLILTALGLSVTLLLRWANSSDEREARKEATRAAEAQAFASGQPYVAQVQPAQPYAGQGYPAQQTAPQYPAPAAQAPAPQIEPESAEPLAADPAGPVSSAPLQPEGFDFQQRAHDAQQAEEPELLPWPTFADGTPIPAGPDGQPDFSVPGAPQPPQS